MRPKALVVDDEPIILDLREYILDTNGYDITRAVDGDQAARKLYNNYFNLVITDLQMGATSGMDVIRKAKSTCQATRVIMITACFEDKYEREAYRCGVDHYLLKPFSRDDLLEGISIQTSKPFYIARLTIEREQNADKVSGKFTECKTKINSS